MRRRYLSAVLGLFLMSAGLAVPLSVADAASPVTRLAGADRYATAVAISKATYPSGADTVFVASGESFADGLSGGSGAAKLNGSLLLVTSRSIPAVVTAELKRLGPKKIYVLGGKSAVSDGVATKLAPLSTGGVQRLFGADRFATSAAVAGLWSSTVTVYLASGSAFPDALSGGAAAAGVAAPLLLTRTSALADATRAALSRLRPSNVIVVGGTAAVSTGVQQATQALLPSASVSRVGGADRYETSAKLLTASAGAGTHTSTVMLASGQNFPDALAGIPASAARNTWFALTKRTCTPESVKNALQQVSAAGYILLGGTSSLSSSTVTTTCSTSPPPSSGGSALDKARKTILDDTNKFRADNGKAPLKLKSGLNTVAQNWTEYMASHGLQHNPNFATQIPPGWTKAAENIASGYSVSKVVAGWIGSPSHRANLLGDYNYIGIGWAHSGTSEGDFYTQDFARY